MFDDLLDAFGKDRTKKASRSGSGGLLGSIGRLLEGDGDDDRRRDDRYRSEDRGSSHGEERRGGFDFDDLDEFGDGRSRRRDDDDDEGFGRSERRGRGFDVDFGD
jgi:hypothetical protein